MARGCLFRSAASCATPWDRNHSRPALPRAQGRDTAPTGQQRLRLLQNGRPGRSWLRDTRWRVRAPHAPRRRQLRACSYQRSRVPYRLLTDLPQGRCSRVAAHRPQSRQRSHWPRSLRTRIDTKAAAQADRRAAPIQEPAIGTTTHRCRRASSTGRQRHRSTASSRHRSRSTAVAMNHTPQRPHRLQVPVRNGIRAIARR